MGRATHLCTPSSYHPSKPGGQVLDGATISPDTALLSALLSLHQIVRTADISDGLIAVVLVRAQSVNPARERGDTVTAHPVKPLCTTVHHVTPLLQEPRGGSSPLIRIALPLRTCAASRGSCRR